MALFSVSGGRGQRGYNQLAGYTEKGRRGGRLTVQDVDSICRADKHHLSRDTGIADRLEPSSGSLGLTTTTRPLVGLLHERAVSSGPCDWTLAIPVGGRRGRRDEEGEEGKEVQEGQEGGHGAEELRER